MTAARAAAGRGVVPDGVGPVRQALLPAPDHLLSVPAKQTPWHTQERVLVVAAAAGAPTAG
ncbi:hypothetical protein ABZ614_40645 [Streptomyces sp. NPDC013178]|uniref:hypothetical protein n=1 Tax=unclassified Streptomyces TaxID=2593676 RepID=UPI00340B2587